MAQTINMAAHQFFTAFEEFNMPETDSAEFTTPTISNFNQQEKSVLRNLFDACEKFNLPNVSSSDSMSSLASGHSSCSNFDELLELQDASFLRKLFLAVQSFSFMSQGHSRLPGAPKTAPVDQAPLTFEQLSGLQKLLVAFDEFTNPPVDETKTENFPKFC